MLGWRGKAAFLTGLMLCNADCRKTAIMHVGRSNAFPLGGRTARSDDPLVYLEPCIRFPISSLVPHVVLRDS